MIELVSLLWKAGSAFVFGFGLVWFGLASLPFFFFGAQAKSRVHAE